MGPAEITTWRDVLPDAWKYYNLDPCVYYGYIGNPSGGCLHVTLDDGNISDSNVEFCLLDAIKNKDKPAEELARKLLLLSWRQRARLYLNYDLYAFRAPKIEKHVED